jgi:aminoglycoside/choline kinase family phosphotransferase
MFNEQEHRQHICSLAAASGFEDPGPDSLQLLALGGSDRRFYRVRAGKTSCIAMVTPPPGDEQRAWREINGFLQSCSIDVPKIFACDDENHVLLVEDAGDTSLYNILHAEQDRSRVLDYYKLALKFLAGMQVRATQDIRVCACLNNRRFGYDAFRFETDYFSRSFLREHCRIEPPPELEGEFHQLAGTLAAEPVVFMHRDFQSQNLHLKNDRLIAIDFQSATQGPPHYDLVSLLKDAYFVLSNSERDLLVRYYLDICSELDSPVKDPDAFTHTFHLCGLQRNMQALAAFAFLGGRKQKTRFYKHIPAALGYLEETLSSLAEFPCLHTVIAHCKKACQA